MLALNPLDPQTAVIVRKAEEDLGHFGKTISDAFEFYLAHLKAGEVRRMTISELVAARLAIIEKKHSRQHLIDSRSRLNRFMEEFGDHDVSQVTSFDVDEFLEGLGVSEQTALNYRRALSALFSEAVRREACEENPVCKSLKIDVTPSEIGILTVEQARGLLQSADKTILPAIALGLFAGVRKAEILRLDWSQIDLERGLIEIKASQAKTAARRLIEIQPVLNHWIASLAKTSGSVAPSPTLYRDRLVEAREAAGIKNWPANALRHSFASYHLAHFRDAAALALQLGHHGTALLFRHYREMVHPDEAARYWRLGDRSSDQMSPRSSINQHIA